MSSSATSSPGSPSMFFFIGCETSRLITGPASDVFDVQDGLVSGSKAPISNSLMDACCAILRATEQRYVICLSSLLSNLYFILPIGHDHFDYLVND
jgi:hypothetical protein